MNTQHVLDEDWCVVRSALPRDWRRAGVETHATSHLVEFPSDEALLRTLLLHVGRGYSLRETAARVAVAGLADVSDVAILKRLRSSEAWLHRLMTDLVKERDVDLAKADESLHLKLCDSTVIKETGKTGSQWRLHYALSLPNLRCEESVLTPVKGLGNGESLERFSFAKGDHVLADRGFSKAPGLASVARAGAFFAVRLHYASLVLEEGESHEPFPLLSNLETLAEAGAVGEWHVTIKGADGERIPARLCAVRKSRTAARQAVKRLRRSANKKQKELRRETIAHANFVTVVTNFEEHAFSAKEVLDLYRIRWQIELAFKRLKSLAQLGHVPKKSATSTRAWLYAKLVIALLVDKLLRQARSFSPWGLSAHPVAEDVEPVAGIRLHAPRGAIRPRARNWHAQDAGGLGSHSHAP